MKYFPPSSAPSSSSSSGSGSMPLPSHHHQQFGGGDDEAELDADCWAYEGVVLPGGMIMLGRWWSPLDETRRCMGPFVFWNVDKE